MNICNVGDFIKEIKDLSPTHIQRNGARCLDYQHNNTFFDLWYRGERDANWPLRPKVFRDRYNERDLTNRFRVLAKSRHAQTPSYDNYGIFLSLMQHYGLPTRLLDWSTSPLVALYFAIERYIYEPDTSPIDGAVWILNPYEMNALQTESSTTPSIEGWSVRKYLRPAFVDRTPTDSEDDYIGKDKDKAYAVMGTESDSRIFAQQGCFTIHSNATPLENILQEERVLRKVILPAASIQCIAAEMLLCGFRKSTIFPDLVNLATDLTHRFTIA